MSEARYSKKSFDVILVSDEPDDPVDWRAGQVFPLVNDMGRVTAMCICLPNREDKGLHWGACNVWKDGEPEPDPPRWKWNGNLESITMTPSIHAPGRWHGYLTNGKFISV